MPQHDLQKLTNGRVALEVSSVRCTTNTYWHLGYNNYSTKIIVVSSLYYRACTFVSYRQFFISADEKGGRNQYKFPGPGIRLYCKYFCVSRCYHNLPTVQTNTVSLSPSHCSTESQSCRFSVKTFNRFPVAGGQNKFLLPGAGTRALFLIYKKRLYTNSRSIRTCPSN